MRGLCGLLVATWMGGCAPGYLVTDRTADALRTSAADREITAVPALAHDTPRFVRAARLELLPAAPAPTGFVRGRARTRPRSRPLLVGGITALGLGVVLVVAGAAYAATPTQCSGEDFCGFGQAMRAVTIMGCGGGVGVVGVILTAVGGSSPSPEMRDGAAGVVYLPR